MRGSARSLRRPYRCRPTAGGPSRRTEPRRTDAHRRLPPVDLCDVPRHRRRRVAQRLGRIRHRTRLARRAQRVDPRGRHLDRGLGPGRTAYRADATAIGGIASGGLKATDPERYDSLRHPGDSFSYDIFSQAGMRRTRRRHPRPGRWCHRADACIAIGESQSAFRLVTYVNARARGRARSSTAFSCTAAPGVPPRSPRHRRPRSRLRTARSSAPTSTSRCSSSRPRPSSPCSATLPARQPDTDRVRAWEVAGTAHADAYTAGIAFNDAGDGRAEGQLLDVARDRRRPARVRRPINAGPAYAVLQAAIHGLIRWSAGGAAPAPAPPLEICDRRSR